MPRSSSSPHHIQNMVPRTRRQLSPGTKLLLWLVCVVPSILSTLLIASFNSTLLNRRGFTMNRQLSSLREAEDGTNAGVKSSSADKTKSEREKLEMSFSSVASALSRDGSSSATKGPLSLRNVPLDALLSPQRYNLQDVDPSSAVAGAGAFPEDAKISGSARSADVAKDKGSGIASCGNLPDPESMPQIRRGSEDPEGDFSSIPHVRACRTCCRCHVATGLTQDQRQPASDATINSGRDKSETPHESSDVDTAGLAPGNHPVVPFPPQSTSPDHYAIMRGRQRIDSGTRGYLSWSPDMLGNGIREGLPHCDVCHGCTTQISQMPKQIHAFNHSFTMGGGSSHASVFMATSMHGMAGVGVAKLFCIPNYSKKTSSSGAVKVNRCFQKKSQYMYAKVMAMDKLVESIGLNEDAGSGDGHAFIPRAWVERVDAVLPFADGLRVDWDAMFTDFVPPGSVSLSSLVGQHPSTSDVIKAIEKVPSSDVVNAAVFDLLFSVCDRHASNAFINERTSRLSLIDHDMLTMNDTWRPCGVSSIFLPTTRKFEEVIHGADYVRGRVASARPLGLLSPLLLLDYRCHAPSGRIGTSYTDGFRRVMEKAARATVPELMETYGFLDRSNAESLRQRAETMLRGGFEATLELYHGNDEAHVYPWQPPCCSMSVDAWGSPACTNPWRPLVSPRPPAASA